MTSEAVNPYVGAYPWLEARRAVWREIVRYVRRDAPAVETLVELGPGYGDFVDQFPAKHRIAFDLNPDMRAHMGEDVDLRIEDAQAIAGLPAGTDMRLFLNEGGIPAVLFGPGDLRVAHAANESVDVEDVATCASVLTHWVRTLDQN